MITIQHEYKNNGDERRKFILKEENSNPPQLEKLEIIAFDGESEGEGICFDLYNPENHEEQHKIFSLDSKSEAKLLLSFLTESIEKMKD